MGRKADYEVRRAASQAARPEERDALQAMMTKAEDATTYQDQVISYPNRPDGDVAALAAAGVARSTGSSFFPGNDPLGAAVMHAVFPFQARPERWVSFAVTMEPGRTLDDVDDLDDDFETAWTLVRGSPVLSVGEVVYACLYEQERSKVLRCISRKNYPRIILPDSVRAHFKDDETFWVEVDAEYGGCEVGEPVYS